MKHFVSLKVPGEAVPSLIGVRGSKVKDTEQASKTKIRFPREREGEVRVLISGDNSESIQRQECMCHPTLLFLKILLRF